MSGLSCFSASAIAVVFTLRVTSSAMVPPEGTTIAPAFAGLLPLPWFVRAMFTSREEWLPMRASGITEAHEAITTGQAIQTAFARDPHVRTVNWRFSDAPVLEKFIPASHRVAPRIDDLIKELSFEGAYGRVMQAFLAMPNPIDRRAVAVLYGPARLDFGNLLDDAMTSIDFGLWSQFAPQRSPDSQVFAPSMWNETTLKAFLESKGISGQEIEHFLFATFEGLRQFYLTAHREFVDRENPPESLPCWVSFHLTPPENYKGEKSYPSVTQLIASYASDQAFSDAYLEFEEVIQGLT